MHINSVSIPYHYNMPKYHGKNVKPASLTHIKPTNEDIQKDYNKIGDLALNYINKLNIKSSNKDVDPLAWSWIRSDLNDQIEKDREEIRRSFYASGKSLNEYITKVQETVEQNKRGNCSEQATATAKYLIDELGLKDVQIVAYLIQPKGDDSFYSLRDHCNIVVGLPKNADLSKIDQYPDAYMIDPWGNFHLPVKDGIKKLKEMLKFDDKKCYPDTLQSLNYFDEEIKRLKLKS